jgi:crossover junction endodeoxyribonuclease RuvC
MRALGIDPGLVRTGWAVVEPVGLRARVLAHGMIAPRAGAQLPARLAEGARQLRDVLAAYRPDFVALEEVFTAPRHPRSALLMAHMRGAICLVLEEAGVPITAMTATTVKRRLTSGGHASKGQVQRMVLRLTGLSSADSLRLDETDAIALALAALHQTDPTTVSGARGPTALRQRVRELQDPYGSRTSTLGQRRV